MSRQLQAAATVFLNEILLILPMIGIRAFSPPKHQRESTVTEEITAPEAIPSDFDTIVVPAKEDGFNSVFLEKNCWYAVRINKRSIPKIKYIAAYQVAPVSAITHVAEVSEITPYQDSGKYLIKFKNKAQEIKPIPLKGGLFSQPQAPRYTTYSKIYAAEFIHQLWD